MSSVNQGIYRLWASIYNLVFAPILMQARQRAIALLALAPQETLLIPGIGTGLDIPYLNRQARLIGIDFSREMLRRVPRKGDSCLLIHGDAQQLPLPSQSIDAVLCSLVLSVVPNGKQAFAEAWRTLKYGGRMVIFDKFLPEASQLTPLRKILGQVISLLGTDPNRKLSAIIANTPDLTIRHDEPSLLHGQYRIVILEKLG